MASFFQVVVLSCFCLAAGTSNEGELKSIDVHENALAASMDQGTGGKDVSGKEGLNQEAVEDAVNFLVTGIPDSTELKVIDDTLERAKTHVMDKLVQQFEEEQASLKTKMDHLTQRTAQAVAALTNARSKDHAVDACVNHTNELRKIYDACQANVSSATGEKETSCNASKGFSPGIFDISKEDETKHYTPFVQCNFSTFTIVGRNEKCDNFLKFVPMTAENTWDSLESLWSDKNDVCTNTTNKVNQTSDQCKTKFTAWQQAKRACDEKKGSNALARCQFENALDSKCKALKNFDDQVKKIQESQADAAIKYDRVRMAYCLLDKYRHTNQQYCLDDDAKATCKTDLAYFYNETIGTMKYFMKEKAAAELAMSCTENTAFILGKDGNKVGATYNGMSGYYDSFQEDYKSKKSSGSMTVQSSKIPGALCDQPGAVTGLMLDIEV